MLHKCYFIPVYLQMPENLVILSLKQKDPYSEFMYYATLIIYHGSIYVRIVFVKVE